MNHTIIDAIAHYFALTVELPLAPFTRFLRIPATTATSSGRTPVGLEVRVFTVPIPYKELCSYGGTTNEYDEVTIRTTELHKFHVFVLN